MRTILFLFLLLVVTILTSILFSNNFFENFRSSSPTARGVGIGDSYAAPLDLPLTTDNSRFFEISEIPTTL